MRNLFSICSRLRYTLFVIGLILQVDSLTAQKAISLAEAFEQIIESNEDVVDLSDRNIVFNLDDYNLTGYLKKKYKDSKKLALDKDGRIVISKSVRFRSDETLILDSLVVNGTLWINYEIVENGEFDYYSPILEGGIAIHNSIFLKAVQVHGSRILIGESQFKDSVFSSSSQLSMGRTILEKYIYVTDTDEVIFYKSKFHSVVLSHNKAVQITGSDFSFGLDINNYGTEFLEMDEVIIVNNSIKGDLDLSEIRINNALSVYNNKIGEDIIFSSIQLPFSTFLSWDFKSGQLGARIPYDSDSTSVNMLFDSLDATTYHVNVHDTIASQELYVTSKSESIYKSKYLFLSLTSLYKSFYEYFISKGDVESANKCYVELKEIQTGYFKRVYEKEGGYRNYLRWQLNKLVKVYSLYGTDPALALVISSYVILFFALVFFFFPSEWDTTSLGSIKGGFQSFGNRSGKRFFLFWSLITAFMIGILRAITLSLNSFITIGFGNIPTRGVARYACIIEGTLGWFLLMLFSVSIISQLI